MTHFFFYQFKTETQQSRMVHYSDSSDGEDKTDKKDDKGGKVLSKALPQEQAMIRFRYRGI